MSEQKDEIITNEAPPPEPKKKKDPKQVEAGKNVVRWNKRTKEALIRETKRENTKSEALLLGTNIIAAVALGVAGVFLYFCYRKKSEVEQPPPPPPAPPNTITPKIGME